jgi:hypothetical protein
MQHWRAAFAALVILIGSASLRSPLRELLVTISRCHQTFHSALGHALGGRVAIRNSVSVSRALIHVPNFAGEGLTRSFLTLTLTSRGSVSSCEPQLGGARAKTGS